MKAYPLNAYKKGGTYLIPAHTSNTDEFVRDTNSVSLIEYLVDEGYGKLSRRYRLYTRQPMSFADSLEYDIVCPHCGNKLRVCGNQIDSHAHGLYKCRNCDDERSRF